MELYELNSMADLVLRGTVTSIKGKNFSIKVEEVVAGEFSEDEISVEKAKNTPTAKRWGKYVTDEAVLLFLVKDGENWKVLGESGEGEKLVVGTEAFLDSRGGGIKNKFSYHQINPTVNIYAEKVDLNGLCQALKDTKNCFNIVLVEEKDRTGNPFTERYSEPSAEFNEAASDKMRSKSEFHESIIATALEHQK